ncbi:MAG: glutathione-regulated potassium-efflux system protein KefC [Burkholderiales bacterium]|nr:glutathione-regulated potassium-efflux system protein KefC [Burkholderiales bacterium]
MLFDAFIYLAAAVLCVPLAKRFGLGAVLGYLIAGALIGPWGLKFVSDVESILHFSEFGVVLMLFVIGLELEPQRLTSMKKEVFGGGSLQMALSGGALMLAGLALGLDWRAAFAAGFALALSSTAIAMATMDERNFTQTPTGRSAFAVLLFQDIAAIPLLAVVPLLAVAGAGADAASATPVWQRAAIAFAAIAGVIVIGRYLTRPALAIIAGTHLREVFTAFALLLVIGIALLMSAAGLSMALGAFLAGVLLAGSEYRHALETDIEPFKGLLLGLFFISVGMSIDFGLLKSQPLMVAGLVVGLLVLKLVTLWLVARILGVTTRQRWLFAVLLSQGGEFAFVVLAAAKTSAVIAPEWNALLTIAVALSMATTPLLLIAHDRWVCREAAAQREADAIDQSGDVIIAGFGRFGQIIGRLLIANGIRPVVLDQDPDQIEMLRRFGYQVFYGDATRLDLLEAAGAARARLLVNAIDDVDANLALTDLVRESFPNIRILSRARNVSHYVALRTRKVEVVERETFEAALRLGRHALEALGLDRYRARELADQFRRHNIATMDALIPHFNDEAKLLSASKAGRQELEEQFAQDRQAFDAAHGSEDWHANRTDSDARAHTVRDSTAGQA